ncbi:hypothetical protein PF003_g26885 [Phytophthora fragariae]|nr:hypothetical protein PF003_g26885 [Phytophthora fragariae]
MNQALKARFWNEGYLIENLQLSDAILQEALEEVQQLPFSPIFGEVYKLERDPNRLQASITTFGPAMEKVYQTIRNIVTRSDNEWYTKRKLWAALKSLPGGLRQGIPCDFPSFETSKAILEKGAVQASVIVALMSKTHFYIYPGCFGTYVDHDKCAAVTLDAGEFLLFRGDLVHAGADFKKENIRLHCYVRVRGISQMADSTETAVFSSYVCEFCGEICDSRRHLSNHRRYCHKNPKRVKAKEKRKKADERGGHCGLCSVSFTKRSAYHQHNHRRHPKKPKRSVRAHEDEEAVADSEMDGDDGSEGNSEEDNRGRGNEQGDIREEDSGDEEGDISEEDSDNEEEDSSEGYIDDGEEESSEGDDEEEEASCGDDDEDSDNDSE